MRGCQERARAKKNKYQKAKQENGNIKVKQYYCLKCERFHISHYYRHGVIQETELFESHQKYNRDKLKSNNIHNNIKHIKKLRL